MIHAIALDLDDTLLRSDGTISAVTMDALRRWRAAGRHIAIATGRPPRGAAQCVPAELADVPWICYNGAEIRLNGATIYSDLIETESARAVVAAALKQIPDSCIGLEIDDMLYLNRHPSPSKAKHVVEDLLARATGPAAKVLFFSPNRRRDAGVDDGVLAELEGLLAGLPAGTRPMLSNRYNLVQVLSASADKVEALRFLAQRWSIGLEQFMAFGDDVNDVEMLRACGVGVAVANAVPEVLAVADRVTASNNEDGVALVLNELL